MGKPSDREQYIHRLGRTGRKGKEGQGILLLSPWEENFMSCVKDLPIAKVPLPSSDPETKKKVSLVECALGILFLVSFYKLGSILFFFWPKGSIHFNGVKNMVEQVGQALSNVEMKTKESAYQAWLGYYNSDKNVGRDKCRLVELANEFSRSMGLDNPPAIPKLVLSKMGLRNVPGLRAR